MKTNKLISGLIMSTLLFAGCSMGGQTQEEPSSSQDQVDETSMDVDPLTSFISKPESSDSSNLKGDFFGLDGNSLNQYDGVIPSNIQECIDVNNAIIKEEKIPSIIAQYNTNFPNINNQSKDEILADISPVLGYAVVNSQINWEWDSDNKEYSFIPYEGDEVFWYCYLNEGTTFFSNFLTDTQKPFIEVAQLPAPTNLRYEIIESYDPLVGVLNDEKTVRVSWDEVEGASGYVFKYNDIRKGLNDNFYELKTKEKNMKIFIRSYVGDSLVAVFLDDNENSFSWATLEIDLENPQPIPTPTPTPVPTPTIISTTFLEQELRGPATYNEAKAACESMDTRLPTWEEASWDYNIEVSPETNGSNRIWTSYECYGNRSSTAYAGLRNKVESGEDVGAKNKYNNCSDNTDKSYYQCVAKEDVESGILTISEDNSPSSALVIAGMADVPFSRYKATAENEDITITNLAVVIKDPDNTRQNVTSVKIRYTDSNGDIKTATGIFDNNGFANFSNLDIYVESDDPEIFEVLADLNTINNVADSGEKFAIELYSKNDANNNFKAIGQKSSTILTAADVNLPTNTTVNSMFIRKTVPTVQIKSNMNTSLINGENNIYGLTVIADSASDVYFKRIRFNVAGTGLTLNNFAFIKGNSDEKDNITITNSANEDISKNTGSATLIDDGYVVIEYVDTKEAVVVKGSTNIYYLKATVAGATSANNSLSTYIEDDDIPTTDTYINLSTLDYNFIWSDGSAIPHSTTSADWTNGYLVNDLATSSLTLNY